MASVFVCLVCMRGTPMPARAGFRVLSSRGPDAHRQDSDRTQANEDAALSIENGLHLPSPCWQHRAGIHGSGCECSGCSEI